jgi:hypothetical protein
LFQKHDESSGEDQFQLLVESIATRIPAIWIPWLDSLNLEGKLDTSKIQLQPSKVKLVGAKRQTTEKTSKLQPEKKIKA